MIIEFRRRTLLPFDDVLGCLCGTSKQALSAWWQRQDAASGLKRTPLSACLSRGFPARPRDIPSAFDRPLISRTGGPAKAARTLR